MSDSNWRPILAIGIIITLLFAPPIYDRFTLYQARHAQERIEATENEAGAGRQQGEARCSRVASNGGFACSLDIEQPNQTDAYAKYDLRAQQEMAQWALGMLIATIAGVAVTILGLVFIVAAYRLNSEQVHLAREANKNARRAFEEAERPQFFIGVDTVKSGDLHDSPLADFDAFVAFENGGTRPALGTALHARIFARRVDEQLPDPRERWIQDLPNIWEEGREIRVGKVELAWVFAKNADGSDMLVSEALDTLRGVTHRIFLAGMCRYEDPIGVIRERFFCFEAITHTGLLRLTGPPLSWRRVGGSTGNFERRVEQQDER